MNAIEYTPEVGVVILLAALSQTYPRNVPWQNAVEEPTSILPSYEAARLVSNSLVLLDCATECPPSQHLEALRKKAGQNEHARPSLKVVLRSPEHPVRRGRTATFKKTELNAKRVPEQPLQPDPQQRECFYSQHSACLVSEDLGSSLPQALGYLFGIYSFFSMLVSHKTPLSSFSALWLRLITTTA